MPTFGDYETTGEPLASTDGSGHFSQVWLARKTGATDGNVYALKIHVPRRARRQASSEDELEVDRALQFLEGIKQIRKAQSDDVKGGSFLTPIYDFGKTPEGDAAWYVTEFYGEPEPFLPRSLQSYIIRGGRLDGGALRNIIYSIATGCLVLQRSRGFSHGNLKSTNVFRVGKSRPLRKAQIQLADAFPGDDSQLSGLDAEVSQLLQQTMEVQDLRSIGLLILQLVEARQINTEREYDYPVASSAAWEQLGKDAEHWREVCNRLLDPSLSIEQVNLQSLAKEFRPEELNIPMVVGAVGLLVVLIGLVGYWFHASRKKANVPSQAQTQTTTQALQTLQIAEQPQDQTNYIGNNAVIFVTASGAGNLKYQWSFNGKKKSGATGKSLTLTSLRAKDAGTYSVTVSDDKGRATSRPALVTVVPALAPPQITVQPQNQAISNSAGVTLTVSATGPPPLKYQWRLDGAAIGGATTQKLNVSEAGSYDVQVFNGGGSVNSRAAMVTAQQARPGESNSQLQAAQQALDRAKSESVTNLVWGLARVNSVLAATPSDEVALRLRNKIIDAIGAAVTDVLQKGNQALARANIDEAMQQRNFAAYLKADDPRLAQLSASIFNAAHVAATNAIEGVTVNLDEAERYWKTLHQISPAGNETEVVKARIDAYDSIISDGIKADQAMVDAPLKTTTDATNLINALDGTGVFTWRPSRTNATAKLVAQLDQKRLAGLDAGFSDATNALANNNIAAARNRLEFIQKLDAADARVSTLQNLIISAAGSTPPPTETRVVQPPAQTPSQESDHPPVNLFGISFVWVKGIGAGSAGAYVAVNELSWGNYRTLGGRNLVRPPGDSEAMPANFTVLNSARQFVSSLAGAFAAKGFNVRMPTLQEYLAMTGLTDSRVTAADISNLIAAGEHVEDSARLGPSEVLKGTLNRNGLRDVIGNVREWTADKQNPFGLPYYVSRAKGDKPPYNDLARRPSWDSPNDEVFGVRLVLEPANRATP